MAISRAAGLGLHLAVLVWYLVAVQQNLSVTAGGRHVGAASYGGRWKYLTFINMILQTSFFGLCVLTDLLNLLPQPNKRVQHFTYRIGVLQDWFFTALAFPVGFFVVVSFWLIYAYDRELVYPKILDQIIPTWLNHAMHTLVLVLLMVELTIVPHQCSNRKGGIAVLVTFCSCYLLWVLWIHYISAIWVYPILEVLSPFAMGIFLAVAVLITVLLYIVGEKLHHWRWGTAKLMKKLD
ncbi:androgen dependent TFPI regulating protein 1 [Leucoraja erinacea]|uniref:androgen dependent TFPI regulating protein 1 n=1 Tax=Leucoraja erinaceus TaxID=7782 RepID=UPI0024545103|nr:androgen dependent TFPI regulating protein 1 [Leucoraja erinacea]